MTDNNRTILISTNGHILAHVGRTALIGVELKKRGFKVLFAGQGRYMEMVQKAGLEVLSLGGVEGAQILSKARRKMVGAGMFNAEELDTFIQLELKLLEKVQPAAVICDLQPTMAISAPIAGVPCISVANAYLTPYAVPPFANLIFHPLLRPILEPIRRRMASKPFRQLSSKYDIPRNTIFKDLLTRGDLVLLPDIPEFAPTKDLPPHFHYCGPLIWEPEVDSIKGMPEFDTERPTIYFTLGSTGIPEMFHRVLQDLRAVDYQVILTTGSQIEPDELGILPDNFIVESFYPGSKLLDHCSAVVCHGGNGTIYQALGAGRPVVSIPTHVDQKANAYLMEKQGAGLTVDSNKMEGVIPSLKRILIEPSFSENASKLKKIIAGMDGPVIAANLIEEYLGSR
jgi:MGT family glycosyltransferase